MKMNLYDLIMNMKSYHCRIETISNTEVSHKRCLKYGSCAKCVQAWLNEEEGARNG